jgi:hypothetical protein
MKRRKLEHAKAAKLLEKALDMRETREGNASGRHRR